MAFKLTVLEKLAIMQEYIETASPEELTELWEKCQNEIKKEDSVKNSETENKTPCSKETKYRYEK